MQLNATRCHIADLDKSIIIMGMPVIIKMLSRLRLIPLKHHTIGELRRKLGMTPQAFDSHLSHIQNSHKL